jgi:four helix bundle protein
MMHMADGQIGYRQLDVWQTSMGLVQEVYRLTERIPDRERYGLISQAQRASVSVPANIAEGYGCGGGDYARFVRIARGSLMEVEVYLELFVKLGYITRKDIVASWKLSQKSGAMLTRLLQALDRRKSERPPKKPRTPKPERRTPNTDRRTPDSKE